MKKTRWEKFWRRNEISIFPKSRISQLCLSQNAKSFLINVGLPIWAAPHLHFDAFSSNPNEFSSKRIFLPKLRNWSWLKAKPTETPDGYLVLGTAPDENPICIEEGKDELLILNQDASFKKIFMNSSLKQLGETLIEFASMVKKALDIAGCNALIDNRVPFNLIASFERKLANIDPLALGKGAFWQETIAEMKDIKKRKNPLPLKIYGRTKAKNGECKELASVELLLTPSGIDELINFFKYARNQMKSLGKSYSHNHLSLFSTKSIETDIEIHKLSPGD